MPCRDASGNTYQTHGCVIDYNQGSKTGDLGSLISYQSLANSTLGVHIELTHGTALPGCSSVGKASIDLVCNPLAPYNTVSEAANFDPCNPHIIIQSINACPLCTADDYRFYYTECYNGTRTQVYQWDEPTNCHGGVALPANQVVTCSTNTHVCDQGYILNAAGNGCDLCDAAGYSLGGGYLVNQWGTLPAGMRTECTSAPCTKWGTDYSQSGYISGYGTSSLVAVMNFNRIGAVVFTYELYSTGDSQLQFFMDGVMVWSLPPGTNKVRPTTQTIGVSEKATHEFKWTFVGGTEQTAEDTNSVEIRQIFFQNVDYHADACLPCPAGTRPSVVSVDSAIGCTPCGRNTFAPSAGYAQCLPCASGYFASVPGQTSCDYNIGCTTADYKISYSACDSNGNRLKSYVLAPPYLCSLASYAQFTPPAPVLVPCAPCPSHSYRNSLGTCVGCSNGQYYDNAQQKCVANTAGSIVRRTSNYFYDGYYPAALSAEFSTGCDGECYDPPGWRVMADHIDSGRGEVAGGYKVLDSYLIFSPTLGIAGAVTFNYSLYTTNIVEARLIFLVDGLPYVLGAYPAAFSTAYGTVYIPLSSGPHTLEWNIHQTSGEAQFIMSNLTVIGSGLSDAASEILACPPGTFSKSVTDFACTPCPSGQYNANSGATTCNLCPLNTYNPSTGAVACSACEHGSSASSTGSQTCTANCQFSIGQDSYSLQSMQSSVTVYDAEQQRFDISVCGLASNCLNSHICITDQTTGITSGSGSSFRVAENTDNNTYVNSPFSVYFEHGTVTESCPNGTSTMIGFECNPFASASLPIFITQDACTAIFFWQTLSACHVCTDADYQTVVGSCTGGRRFISKTLIRGCNGPTSIPVSSEDCSAREIPTGAIVAIVIIFVALVALSVGIFLRNRFLYRRYSRLAERDRLQTGGKVDKESELGEVNSAVL